jgi:hypothetical protein
MTEELQEESRTYRLAKNRFVLLIVVSIIVSLVLVAMSLSLYAWSGAAQVDLSRPGYSGIRSQVSEDQEPVAFPSSGSIDAEVLNDYEVLYNKTATQVTSVDAFESGALSDETLRINQDPAATANQ